MNQLEQEIFFFIAIFGFMLIKKNAEALKLCVNWYFV